MAMIDDLIDAVARAGQLPTEQASLAVGAMLRFLAARLPSPLFGELQSRLQPPSLAIDPNVPPSQSPTS